MRKGWQAAMESQMLSTLIIVSYNRLKLLGRRKRKLLFAVNNSLGEIEHRIIACRPDGHRRNEHVGHRTLHFPGQIAQ